MYKVWCPAVNFDDPVAEADSFAFLLRVGKHGYGAVSSDDEETGASGADCSFDTHLSEAFAREHPNKPDPAMFLPPMAAVKDLCVRNGEVARLHMSEVGMFSDSMHLMQLEHSELDGSEHDDPHGTPGAEPDEAAQLLPTRSRSSSHSSASSIRKTRRIRRAMSANMSRISLNYDEAKWYEWWCTNFVVYGGATSGVLWLALPSLVDVLSTTAVHPILQKIFMAAVGVAVVILSFVLVISPIGWSQELIHILFRMGVLVNAVLSIVEFNYSNYNGFVINGAIAIGVAIHYLRNIKKFSFAQTVLSACASCFWDNALGFCLVLAVLVTVQCIWCLIWGLAANRVLKWLDAPDRLRPGTENAISTVDYNAPAVFPVICVLFFVLLWGVAMIRFYAEAMMGGVVTSWCVRPRCRVPVRASLHLVSQWSFVATWYGAVYIPVVGIASDLIGLVHGILQGINAAATQGQCPSSGAHTGRETSEATGRGGVAAGASRRGGATDDELPSNPERSSSSSISTGSGSWCFFSWACVWHLKEVLAVYVQCVHARMCTLRRRLNRYSVAVAVARGYPVQTAGMSATVLFEQRDWLNVANDGTLVQALSFGELLLSCFGIQAGYIASKFFVETQVPNEYRVTMALCSCGGLMGYAVGNTLASCFGTGIAAMIYTLAHDRGDALSKGQPLRYQELATAWNRDHPGTLFPPPRHVSVVAE